MNNTIIFCPAGMLSAFVAVGHTQEATIMIHADQVLHEVQPIQKQWRPRFENGKAEYDFQPHSFTVIRLDQDKTDTRLFCGHESGRWRQGELLAQGLYVIQRHGIGGIMLKNFIKLCEGFGIFSFIDQRHAQI